MCAQHTRARHGAMCASNMLVSHGDAAARALHTHSARSLGRVPFRSRINCMYDYCTHTVQFSYKDLDEKRTIFMRYGFMECERRGACTRIRVSFGHRCQMRDFL